jgi:hypothetical protein
MGQQSGSGSKSALPNKFDTLSSDPSASLKKDFLLWLKLVVCECIQTLLRLLAF